MQAENWKTVKETLLEALKRDSSSRRGYLDQANLSAEVRAEVESLLTHESNAKDFMSVTASGFTREFFNGCEDSAPSLINQKLGIYEVVSELGLGGMGAVYLARRADGKFEQRVAIKMLKREFNVEKIRRNFEREKEILATLSHPNIASLLDAGTTEDGIPYLVMEYIQGVSIDEFCHGQKLSLNSRLKLFIRVCETVAFAHHSLIVHRDLKPSNILVTKDGEPKLLDFGISKLLDPEADGGNITNLGALTPLYASPEQIKGEPVTTATDVYSLGVVLFKILTGSLPHTPGKGVNGNLLNEMAQTKPTLPSEAARRASVGRPISGDSQNSPILPSELKGDLDKIVLQALRKEPARRYSTVEQFSADIWRFIDGMPVLARPATISYRASKFYGRNKVPVLAAAFVLISLLVGIGISVSQARAARLHARIASAAQLQAELETERTKAEKQKAERTSRFMQSFLEYANPHWYGRGKGRLDVTVREAIDDAARRIDPELADEPQVRADLHYTIGEVYSAQGESDAAFKHFRQSLDLYRRVHGEQHPKVARGIYYVSLFETEGEKAEALLRQAIEMMRQTDAADINLPYMLQVLAHWIMRAEQQERNESRLAEAETMILEAKTLFMRHYGENHGATFSTDHSLALLARARGDLETEERLLESNLRRHREIEEGSYGHIRALFYVAKVQLERGKVREAETLFGEALAMGRRQWGANDYRVERLVSDIRQARTAARR